MLVAFGTMYMAVFKLFRSGVTDLYYGDIKVKGDTGQRVVAVNRDGVAFDLFNGDYDRLAIRALGIELHAGFDFRFRWEHAAGYIL